MGDWFAFNAGAAEASSSSPLWTIIGAALVHLGGLAFGIVAIKTLSVAAWVSLGVLVRALAIRLGSQRDVALSGGALAIAMPGTAMNGLQGMENGAFAALVLGAFLAALEPTTPRTTFGAFALAGLAAALRPEGVVVVIAVLAVRAGDLRRDGPIALVALALTAAPCLGWFLLTTEHVVPTSGVSRVMAARRDALSLHAGAIWIYLAPLARLAVYGPLSVGATVGWRRSRLLGATAIAGTALYALVIGAVHTSRYLIWIFVLLIALACAEASTRTVRAIAPWFVWLLAACLGEACVRAGVLGSEGYRISEIARAPAARRETTNALLVEILSGGCHPAVPAVALIEVQERFFLDDRVRVLSLERGHERRAWSAGFVRPRGPSADRGSARRSRSRRHPEQPEGPGRSRSGLARRRARPRLGPSRDRRVAVGAHGARPRVLRAHEK